ncbi:MAG: response regulator transcription factor [Gammaproteobacteria bacterium]|nr:response regulator transcription factor [Gammaproteobacteria bacterium]MCW8840665.1 response regulator transcription factor [Gammaproteobacteria bacterium]MCW8958757.1 response regulator transcription factor [Gammaproteobacteria bacterium]MCW8973075.1 response regulator transcription factor [Gammaproteobacteria bacterium]MCW8993507.1 response regulator transcription factor [Gammaproteobacteria bacterium]
MTEPGTVFVIDDDEAVRDSLSWLVRSAGLQAETFASAALFLRDFGEDRPGCLVLDIRMPGMNGLELQSVLRERQFRLPIIIISGHADVPMAVRALKAGAFDFIEKPFNDQLLLDLVQRALEQDRSQRKNMAEVEQWRARIDSLTPREREVLNWVVSGASNKQISAELGVSLKTVEAHRARVMAKLQADSLSHLVRMAVSVQEN